MRKVVTRLSFKRLSKFGNRKNFVAFFIALLVASFFWFIKSFDQQYSTELLLGINYINLPVEEVSRFPLPKEIKIKIKADGWHLFRLHNNLENTPIIIDMLSFTEKKSISSTMLRTFIMAKLSPEVSILSIFPDNINFEFEKVFKKVVPVEPDLIISYDKFTGLASAVKIEPETIEISGPESEVRKINKVITKQLKLKNLKKPYRLTLKLVQTPNKNIKFSSSKVNILIPVEQLTEGEITIPVSFFPGQTDSISLIPDKVKIRYQVAISNFENVTSSLFNAYYEPKDIWNRKPSLKVYVDVANEFIYKVKPDPEYIDYIKAK